MPLVQYNDSVGLKVQQPQTQDFESIMYINNKTLVLIYNVNLFWPNESKALPKE